MWARTKHAHHERELGVAAAQHASYAAGAVQALTFELERRHAGGRPGGLAVWRTTATTATLEGLREEMRRVAAPQRELPPAIPA